MKGIRKESGQTEKVTRVPKLMLELSKEERKRIMMEEYGPAVLTD